MTAGIGEAVSSIVLSFPFPLPSIRPSRSNGRSQGFVRSVCIFVLDLRDFLL
jgi:hypothetical protein